MDEEKLRELIERAKRRDAEAFGSLYDFYVSGIYRYIYYRVRSKEDAEDLTEEVFLKALGAIGRFTWQEVPFSAWLYRIARNVVIDHFREEARRAKTVAEEEKIKVLEQAVSSDIYTEKFLQEEMKRVIGKLTEDQQEVIVLKFFAELTNKEISSFLNKTEVAVKALQHRALKSLSRILEETGKDEGRV